MGRLFIGSKSSGCWFKGYDYSLGEFNLFKKWFEHCKHLNTWELLSHQGKKGEHNSKTIQNDTTHRVYNKIFGLNWKSKVSPNRYILLIKLFDIFKWIHISGGKKKKTLKSSMVRMQYTANNWKLIQAVKEHTLLNHQTYSRFKSYKTCNILNSTWRKVQKSQKLELGAFLW